MSNLSVKWKMIDRNRFTGEKNGYHITINTAHSIAPYWAILKDGVIIDEAYRHSPTKCDLTAKVQAERVLNKIFEQL